MYDDNRQLTAGSGRSIPLAMELGASFRERKFDFTGIGLSCIPDEEFIEAIRLAVETRSRLAVGFVNPDYVRRAHKSTELLEDLNRFDIVLPDGWGVVLGGRWLGLPVPDRQANDDICPKLFALSALHGFSNFLFGGHQGIPEQAATNLEQAFPDLPIAGTLHGAWDELRGHPGRFEEADVDMMVEAINASGADILHVSIRTPMQQRWVWQAADRLDVPVIISGGGYLDHVAERVDWYPQWINEKRLCWAYRLYREPRRLWRRYTLETMGYGALLLRAKRAEVVLARERRALPAPGQAGGAVHRA
jgi:N-acetylglucosaminyldiphosphoundecaprenol N-acetyl-beta-D-mannosaminyltransferase